MSPYGSSRPAWPLDGVWEAAPLDSPLIGGSDPHLAKASWRAVRVPGHWQLEPGLEEYEGRMAYRRTFEAERPAGGEMLSLRFEGVYYLARVWLNRTYLGTHEGYFAPFELDCTDLVREGENRLLVEVASPREPDENDRRTVGGVWAHWDGMDPRINPGGIYRPVTLLRGGPVRILSLGVSAAPSGHGKAVVHLYSRDPAEVRLRGEVHPLGFDAPGARLGLMTRLPRGHTRVELPFYVPEVRTWWTRDRGGQPMYELDLRCGEERARTRFGARSVELCGWHVYLNGERTFLRGVNYLPADAYPARAEPELYRSDAALLEDLNLNAVRVHAHISGEEFYDACDEKGILVVQDFPLQWKQRRRVLEPAVKQAREMAALLRGHPSVGIYLAHDEPFYVVPPEKWSLLSLFRTVAEVSLPRWALWQRRVLDRAVVEAMEDEDRSRPVIDAAGHPLTTNHLYFGWYYGTFRDLERAVRLFPVLSRMPTEFGAQALPDPESLQEIWPAGKAPDWNTLNERHRLQRDRMELYVPWRGDRDAYVRDTQEYQASLLKHAVELFRVRKYRPTGGAFPFMLNDPAPAVSWSVVDWRRRRKLGYEAIEKAMRPLLVCARYPKESYVAGERLRLPVFVVNDLPWSLGPARWGWSLEVEGETAAGGEGELRVSADSVARPGEVCAPLPAPGRAALRLWISAGEERVENEYPFSVRAGRSGMVTKG